MRLFRNYDPFESEVVLGAHIFAKKWELFLWILWFDIRHSVCYNKYGGKTAFGFAAALRTVCGFAARRLY